MNPENMTGYREPTEQEAQKVRRLVEKDCNTKIRGHLIIAIVLFAVGLLYFSVSGGGGGYVMGFIADAFGFFELYRQNKIRKRRDAALSEGFKVLDGHVSGVFGSRMPGRCEVEFTSNAGEVLVDRRPMRREDAALNAPLLLAYSGGSFWLAS